MPNKICEVCQQLFRPDHRVGPRQRVCGKLECKQERKRRAQRDWLRRNPGYFKGRYPMLKIWLAEHPNYLKEYRIRRKDFGSKEAFFDIQDKLTYNKNSLLTTLHGIVDIQDEISSKMTMIKRGLTRLAQLIYKTSEVTKNTATYAP